MKKFFGDFKQFIKKGKVTDLAVAVVIGAAFNKIVSSFVNDIIMPLVSLAVGGADVSDWKWIITPAEYDAEGVLVTAETAFRYGAFIQSVIDFLIIALVVFLIVKATSKIKDLGEDIKGYVEKQTKSVEEKTEVNVDVSATTPNAVENSSDNLALEQKASEQIKILTEIRDMLKNTKSID